jgi:hypothetical protein
MTKKQIIIPCGDSDEVITEAEVRDVQKRLTCKIVHSEVRKLDVEFLDAILSYFCKNVLSNGQKTIVEKQVEQLTMPSRHGTRTYTELDIRELYTYIRERGRPSGPELCRHDAQLLETILKRITSDQDIMANFV